MRWLFETAEESTQQRAGRRFCRWTRRVTTGQPGYFSVTLAGGEWLKPGGIILVWCEEGTLLFSVAAGGRARLAPVTVQLCSWRHAVDVKVV